ncbi:MAG: aldo/keto reductase [Pseudomonadota bacterium]
MTLTSLNGTPASALTFGTMQFGGNADEGASRAMWEACRTAGITHFDTAWVYTGGASETITGKLAGGDRDSLIIATKAAYTGGAGGANIRAQFDESRRRLAMDMVDILYMHRFDDDTPLEDTFEALAALQQAGQIRYIGVSNYAAWQVMKAQSVAQSLGTRIDILQPMYSLVKRQAEVELLPMAADQGITVAPYSPLGGGLLSGKYANGGTGRLTEDKRYAARYAPDFMAHAAQGLSDIAAREGCHPATLAVAWAAAHPTAPHPIISARNADQLAPSLAANSYDMAPDLYAEIASLAPTPPPATDRIEEA